MTKRIYLIKNIYQVHLLAVRILADDGKPVVLPCGGFERRDPVCCSPALMAAVYESGERADGQYAVYDDGGYFYCVFRKKDENVIWGPFVLEVHSENQDRMYLGRSRVKEKTICIPFLEMNYVRGLISFMHGLLFDAYGETDTLFADNRSEEAAEEHFQADLSRYIMESIEQEREHSSYQREREFFEYLLEGRVDAGALTNFGAQDQFRDMRDRQGIVAESKKKQLEYSAVTFIALLTRHVMNAGVSETEAYRLSDVCLQELSRAENMIGMELILQNSVKRFIRAVKEHRAAGGEESHYVSQSKDYVANHIFEKISLPEIAEHVGVHPAYLSRVFTGETGIGISQYILQEKIRISCNLLKYSGRPIATIAEYVGLSPQSYYSKVFKKVMNQTPAQYRKEHRNKKFS